MSRVYKRGRIWWAVYYDEDGKRKRRSTRCTDKRAAVAIARRLERSSAAGPDPTQNQTTLAAACDAFRLDRRNRGRSPATLSYYGPKLRHLLRIFGSALCLDDIDPSRVDSYIAQRLDEGASRHTVAKELGALRGVLKLALRRGQYLRDPTMVLPEGWSGGYEPRRGALSIAQARALLAELPPSRAAHIAFLFATGASWGPSCRAKRSDFDLVRGTIFVRGSKTATRRRVVPVCQHSAEFAAMAYAGAQRGQTAYDQWTNVRRDVAAACSRAGVPRVSPNDCRRSAATWLVEMGAPSNLVAYFLGHKDSRMVERVYGRVDGPQLAKAFAAVGVPQAAQSWHTGDTEAG